MKVLVIHEYCHVFKEHSVIGLADSVDNAKKIIDKYYGAHEQTGFRDIRDSSIECEYQLSVDETTGRWEYIVTLEWFGVNSL